MIPFGAAVAKYIGCLEIDTMYVKFFNLLNLGKISNAFLNRFDLINLHLPFGTSVLHI